MPVMKYSKLLSNLHPAFPESILSFAKILALPDRLFRTLPPVSPLCIPVSSLRTNVPFRKCTTPHIRFLFVAPRFWIGLPSDPTSR